MELFGYVLKFLNCWSVLISYFEKIIVFLSPVLELSLMMAEPLLPQKYEIVKIIILTAFLL